MSDWTTVTLGEASVSLDARRKPVKSADRKPGPYPYYGASGVVDYVDDYLFDETTLLVSEDGENLRTRKTPIAFLASGRYWVNNHAHVLVAASGFDLRFLNYAMQVIDLAGYLTGSTQPKLTAANLGSIRLSAPPLEEQQRIAGVLGAVDDLIDTNRTLVNTLIERAREGFRRLVPAEAQTLTYSDVADVFGGGTPSTTNEEYWNGDIAWTTPTDVTRLRSPFLFDSTRKITVAGLEACASDLHPVGSILMTSRATIGAFALAQIPTAVNQGFIVVRPRADIDRTYLLLEMMTRVPDYLDHANGSTFMEISRGRFKALPVPWPSSQDRVRIHVSLSPLIESAAAIEIESAELARTRDELLPLLMSGRVRVSERLAGA